ncbi:hypothetical protein BGX28_000771 [Mortierella sp. GBA30]|nr:hypothetical protein BGX28_000771 [Mortierella sp. GBA30]
MTAVSQDQNAFKFWGPIAYTRLVLYTTAYILRSTVRHVFGRTPRGQGLLQVFTIQILKLIMSVKVLNINQARKMMDVANAVVHLKNGTFRQSSKDQWATRVNGKGWEGFWIPFKDQLDKKKLKEHVKEKVSIADIGAGCDIVMFAIHGGGMVMGDALMFLGNYRSWMKEMQKNHNLKIGVLSVEYTLSPEAPYPGALNECVAAYRHLIEHQAIDPRRVVMCGDSAGGNLCLTTALKIRDDYPHIGLPAGQVLFSPWVMCPKPLKESPDDYITAVGGRLFMEAYTQNLAKVQTSHYASPIQAPTLAGMPRMLIFIGGVETLRLSIEGFVTKAIAEGVDVTAILKDNHAHDYALIQEIAGTKVVREAEAAIGKFVAKIRDEYIL